MKKYVLLFLACCPGILAQPLASATPDPVQLLETMRAGIPTEGLRIEADIETLDRRGEIKTSYRATADLHFEETPPRTVYQLSDAFGTPLTSLEVIWTQGQPQLHSPTQDGTGSVPQLTDNVLDTDMSWNDVLLGYLWVDTGTYLGESRAKNRLCHVIEYAEGETRVRLWIDQHIHILLRAETRDTNNKVVREMNVRSFKKVDERWILQDLEVKSFPKRTRTLLRVRTVAPLSTETSERVPISL